VEDDATRPIILVVVTDIHTTRVGHHIYIYVGPGMITTTLFGPSASDVVPPRHGIPPPCRCWHAVTSACSRGHDDVIRVILPSHHNVTGSIVDNCFNQIDFNFLTVALLVLSL
jgi:hypothetical protein